MATSGLIHRWPLGFSEGEVSTVTEQSSGAGDDPDSWTGYTDNGAGVKGTDYELDTNGGRSRLRDLSTGGRAVMRSTASLTVSSLKTYAIFEDLTETNTGTVDSYESLIALKAYDATAMNEMIIGLEASGASVSANWRVRHTDSSTFANTGKTRSTQRKVFMYMAEGAWAVWFDGDAAPTSGNTPDPLGALGSGVTIEVVAGSTVRNNAATIQMGPHSAGTFTTA